MFYTDVYSYDENADCVYFRREFGICDVEGVDTCMVFYEDLVHYEVVQNHEV